MKTDMSYNPYSLNDRTVLITGAGSGIGRAVAIECSRLGAKCVICGRNVERLQETLTLMDGGGHVVISADLTSEDGLKAIAQNTPCIDGLVNNAGINKTAPIYFLKEDVVKSVFEINTFTPMFLTKTLLSARKIKAGASIVFTSSIDGVTPSISTAAYGSSKAALTNFMKVCAKELSPRMIRANAVHPGMVQTDMVNEMRVSDEDLKNDMQQYLLKRYGRPEEIAWAIIYLLSDASAWVTGSVLTIDGGISIK